MSMTLDIEKKETVLGKAFNALLSHQSLILEQDKPSIRFFLNPHMIEDTPAAEHGFAMYIHNQILGQFDLKYDVIEAGWRKNSKGIDTPFIGVSINNKKTEEILSSQTYQSFLAYKGVTEIQTSTGLFVDLSVERPVQKLQIA